MVRGISMQMQFNVPQNVCTIASVVSDTQSTGIGNFKDSAGNPISAKGFLLTAVGTLKVRTTGGQVISFNSGDFAANVQYSLDVLQVFNTGTAATGYLFW